MHDTAFLFDVDNTLLDNDAVQDDLRAHLAEAHGEDAARRYWELFEQQRTKLGYADYLGALQRYREEEMHDPRVLRMALWLLDYPFQQRLFPGALDALAHAAPFGPTVILSDGDAVFQPRKVERSGLWRAVNERVLIYIHKEQELANVARLYPARHYVLVDDKVRILDAVKRAWGPRVTTMFPVQGHYANDPAETARYGRPDITLPSIGHFCGLRPEQFTSGSS